MKPKDYMNGFYGVSLYSVQKGDENARDTLKFWGIARNIIREMLLIPFIYIAVSGKPPCQQTPGTLQLLPDGLP